MSDSVTIGAAQNYIFQVQKPGGEVDARAHDSQVDEPRVQAETSPHNAVKPISAADQDGARNSTSHQSAPPPNRGQVLDLSV